MATCLPGIAPVLVEEIGGATRAGFDGRNELVSFDARGNDVITPRTAEDVFVEVSRVRGDAVDKIVDVGGIERALSVYATVRGPLRSRMTYRVVARVLSEGRFLRTQFRDRVAAGIARARPKWEPGDPADIELWALEVARDSYVLALRLTTSAQRHRGARAVERPGSLRPTVAAAMLFLAFGASGGAETTSFTESGDGGVLVDPCCGSGTILQEAGGRAIGGDIDPEAVRVARANTRVPVAQWDARHLPLARGAAAAVVSNLPFGRQFAVDDEWYRRVLSEARRVTYPRARIVVLAPRLPDTDLTLQRSLDIELLGVRTTIWCFRVA